MNSQIFKQQIPNEIIIDLLNNISIKNDNYFVVNNSVYKKGIYNNSINLFLEKCKPYYYLSKRFYLERKMTYNHFITILRQICKFNNILYKTEVKYDKSTYDIIYHILL